MAFLQSSNSALKRPLEKIRRAPLSIIISTSYIIKCVCVNYTKTKRCSTTVQQMYRQQRFVYFNQHSYAHSKADASIANDLRLHEDKPDNSLFEAVSQDSCCESEFGSEEEACDDIAMRPPLPYNLRNLESSVYYLRNLESSVPNNLSHDARKRGSSFQNLRREACEKDSPWSPQMSQAMPSLCSSRSMHNRRMGSTMEFLPKKANLASRIKEFEALLADL